VGMRHGDARRWSCGRVLLVAVPKRPPMTDAIRCHVVGPLVLGCDGTRQNIAILLRGESPRHRRSS